MSIGTVLVILSESVLLLFCLFLLWLVVQASRLIDRIDAEKKALQEQNKQLLKSNLDLASTLTSTVLSARKHNGGGN